MIGMVLCKVISWFDSKDRNKKILPEKIPVTWMKCSQWFK